jgi:hypothetical protein
MYDEAGTNVFNRFGMTNRVMIKWEEIILSHNWGPVFRARVVSIWNTANLILVKGATEACRKSHKAHY